MILRATRNFYKASFSLELCSLFGLAVYVNVNTQQEDHCLSLAESWDEVTVTLTSSQITFWGHIRALFNIR